MIKRLLATPLLYIALFLGMVTTTTFPIIPSEVSAAPVDQSQAELACRGSGGTWDGDECNSGEAGNCLFGSGCVVTGIINVLIFLAGGLAVIMIIIGGIRYVISAGDQNAVTAAKNTILYAVIGLVVTMLAYAAVQFIISSLG